MKKESTLLVCNLGGIDDSECLGELVDTNGVQAPVYGEVFEAVQYYLSETERVNNLLLGQGIATCRNATIISEWRRVDELLKFQATRKIAQLPRGQQELWHVLMYRKRLQLCFLLPAAATVQKENLEQLSLVRASIRANKGNVVSLVASDPVQAGPKQVLRLAAKSKRFSTVPPSKENVVQGLTVIGHDHYLVLHPPVQKILLAS